MSIKKDIFSVLNKEITNILQEQRYWVFLAFQSSKIPLISKKGRAHQNKKESRKNFATFFGRLLARRDSNPQHRTKVEAT
jgi:hypothetical protein